MLIPSLNKVFCYSSNLRYTRKDISRFIKKIKFNLNNGCWEYMGVLNRYYYGQFNINRNNKSKTYLAHRVSWELFSNQSIPDGKVIMHTCDNRKCCNPGHLKLGTHQDNINDMFAKGRGNRRGAIGERSHTAKLTWELVGKIRRLYSTGKYTQQQLADRFSVVISTISNIVNNKAWKV
jgi:hypothetical protein